MLWVILTRFCPFKNEGPVDKCRERLKQNLWYFSVRYFSSLLFMAAAVQKADLNNSWTPEGVLNQARNYKSFKLLQIQHFRLEYKEQLQYVQMQLRQVMSVTLSLIHPPVKPLLF